MHTEASEQVVASYDELFRSQVDYLGIPIADGYANLGYWDSKTEDPIDACQALARRVCADISPIVDRVLDVGCGLGGTTATLARSISPEHIHGVNVSEQQLESCRTRLPTAHFHHMRAEALDFADESFDAIVSVEAALHFQGRADFLREAWRILRPGGTIAVADLLFHSQPTTFLDIMGIQECYPQLNPYHELWNRAGFSDLNCDDVTKPVWHGFMNYRTRRLMRDIKRSLSSETQRAKSLEFVRRMGKLPVSFYVIMRATKSAGA